MSMVISAITGLLMTDYKPTYFLHVWNLQGGQLAFEEITGKTLSQCKEWWEYHKRVGGKTATVFVFFEDYDLTDREIIALATDFMKGNTIRHDVDLDKLTETISKGIGKQTPLH